MYLVACVRQSTLSRLNHFLYYIYSGIIILTERLPLLSENEVPALSLRTSGTFYHDTSHISAGSHIDGRVPQVCQIAAYGKSTCKSFSSCP